MCYKHCWGHSTVASKVLQTLVFGVLEGGSKSVTHIVCWGDQVWQQVLQTFFVEAFEVGALEGSAKMRLGVELALDSSINGTLFC